MRERYFSETSTSNWERVAGDQHIPHSKGLLDEGIKDQRCAYAWYTPGLTSDKWLGMAGRHRVPSFLPTV